MPVQRTVSAENAGFGESVYAGIACYLFNPQAVLSTKDENAEPRQVQEKEHMQQKPEQLLHPPRFAWPTSKPGPQVMRPPPGQEMLPGRTEQVLEVGYNQVTGTPATDDPRRAFPDETQAGTTSFEQPETAQDVARKRRKRR